MQKFTALLLLCLLLPFAHAESETLSTEFHGGGYLWYTRPLNEGSKDQLSLYIVYFEANAKYDDFGLHAEPRIKDNALHTWYSSNIWLQEGYGYYRQPDYSVKVGKVYTRFGKFWDGTWYANVPFFDGVKLDPNDGASLEGRTPGFPIDYDLQYFVNDGGVNGSLGGVGGANGRDTISIPNARKRNMFVGRVAPTVGPIQVGASYEHFIADIPATTGTALTNQPGMWSGVSRAGGDITLTLGNFSIWGEYANQNGQTVIDFPNPGQAARKINYYWAGTSYKMPKMIYYYVFSEGDYSDVGVREMTHVVGMQYEWRKFLTVIPEYGYWYRTSPGDKFTLEDNSVNLVLKAYY